MAINALHPTLLHAQRVRNAPVPTERGDRNAAQYTSFSGIQYTRGVAALSVVAYHIAAQMTIDPAYGRMPLNAMEFGDAGVPIFFVVSGFIITIASLDPLLRPRLTVASFVAKRSVRILPLMWLAIIAYNLVSLAGTHAFAWQPFMRAMSLWPSGTVKPNVIWTLRHEALFYALFAVSFLGKRRRTLLVALWCISPIILSVACPDLKTISVADPTFLSFVCSDMNFMFGAGVLIGLYTLSQPARMRAAWPGGAPAVYLGCTLVIAIAWLLDWRTSSGAHLGLTIVSSALIVLAVKLRPGGTRFDQIALVIGNASFSIYLTHNIVIVPALLAGRHLVGAAGLWPMFLAIAAAAIMTGVLTHFVVERPLIAAITRRISHGTRVCA